ncbi:hypothetical protein GUITHDRAFT_111803 [Guillardia theta CCMP2712]|uniref:Nucleoporin Nup159/Nup146 N-terminal domain-containing protein n=1 Tax=Guillardia theta (strain CCMP2712) TaxID=905079 RepID=L1J1R0_GUITC|nr:hypothetical protein GUITHDRAFT_111803 [Guillardia theta CCMP2712]EKX42242.1 hypothetical protein GUITHDRAFT_111803 [Guillardia theta CCMP2712]|eukprot:XP_005829222.1 hypothetical protein GUITHDRAFT_111803 [Guillardia theta CCMP2712]
MVMGRDLDRYKTQKKNALHEDSIWALSWPQDDRLISGSIDETVKVWKMASDSGEKMQQIEVQPISTFPGHFLGVVSVSATKDGKLCAVSSLDGRIRIWNLEERAVQRSIDPGLVETWTVCFHPSGEMLASGTQTGKINVYQTHSKEDKPEATIKSDGRFILATAYSPCGRMIAAGSNDGVVSLFDTENGNLIRKLEAHSSAVRSIAWSPDSQTVLTGSQDKSIMIHDVSAKTNAAMLPGHDSWVLSVAHNPSRPECISGGSDKKVRVWDLAQRQLSQIVEEHTDQVWAVDYNPSGTRFVSSGDDGALVVGQSLRSGS